MLTKILLGFTILCNFATLLGLWIGYQAAPASIQASVGHIMLTCGAIASIAGYGVFAWLLTKRARDKSTGDESKNLSNYKELYLDCQTENVKLEQKHSEVTKQLEALQNSGVKELDPQLEIKFCDLRGNTMSQKTTEQACFDLICRSKHSGARFACIEDFYVGSYKVVFRSFPPVIAPFAHHESIYPLYINNPDGKLCEQDIFSVFLYAWSEKKNTKLYDLAVPIKITYQDDARNLFEIHCDLVFYPSEHLNRSRGLTGSPVIEVKNQKTHRVATAISVDWMQ